MYNDYNVLLQQRHLLQAEHFFMFYNPLSYRKCLNIIYAWCPLTLNHLSTAFSLPCSDDFKTKQKNSIPSSQPFFFFFKRFLDTKCPVMKCVSIHTLYFLLFVLLVIAYGGFKNMCCALFSICTCCSLWEAEDLLSTQYQAQELLQHKLNPVGHQVVSQAINWTRLLCPQRCLWDWVESEIHLVDRWRTNIILSDSNTEEHLLF